MGKIYALLTECEWNVQLRPIFRLGYGILILSHVQGRINRAGLTIVPVVPWGPPDQLPNFYHAVLTFECLNVCRCSVGLKATSTKKRSSVKKGPYQGPV